VLFRCSDADGGEHLDNSYYKRENVLMVIGGHLLRRHAAT
jgi:hypothetical protein